jgi:4-oxalocrotonate tautomerase
MSFVFRQQAGSYGICLAERLRADTERSTQKEKWGGGFIFQNPQKACRVASPLAACYLSPKCLCNLFEEPRMPYVNIRIAGTLSREQKARIAEEITDTLERIAHKPASYTYIAFDELPYENWAIAGKLLDENKEVTDELLDEE